MTALSELPCYSHGILIPIGGAEDRVGDRTILRQFVELCGNDDGKIVVIPCASAYARRTGETYCNLFAELGAGTVECLHVDARERADDPQLVALFENATGIFMSGGDQVKLLSLIGGTAVTGAIFRAFYAGAHIAGTSAGASAMSRDMIAFGGDGLEPWHPVVHMMPGLGLTSLVIDQHFSQRRRLRRLQSAVAMTETAGIGVDENTALMLRPDGTGEVIGAGTVTLISGIFPGQSQRYLSGQRFTLPAGESILSESAAD